MSERREWWIDYDGYVWGDQHDAMASSCKYTTDKPIHVREVLPGDEETLQCNIRLAKHNAAIAVAARAVVDCRHSIDLEDRVEALNKALESEDG